MEDTKELINTRRIRDCCDNANFCTCGGVRWRWRGGMSIDGDGSVLDVLHMMSNKVSEA